jgi:hypothetical protein
VTHPPSTTSASRLDRIEAIDPSAGALARRAVRIAVDGLPRMYRPETRSFAHTRRRGTGGILELVGTNPRYDAIVLLGIRILGPLAQRSILAGETAEDFCGRLLARVEGETDLGAAALLTWAAAEMAHSDLDRGIRRLERLRIERDPVSTVEAAWTVSALLAAGRDVSGARATLHRAFLPETGLFAHTSPPEATPWIRRHVSCFADLVYPIQALARCYEALGERSDLEVAVRCAEAIRGAQGEHGQWCWHYDGRTGAVIERYPVYAVHQDGMAPMALFDLEEAGGPSFEPEIAKGLTWLGNPPERGESLFEEREGVIWRKVARRDPRKLVRRLRAAASRLLPSVRLGWLDRLFPPRSIDFECRPYHLGWILYAWSEHP